MHFQPLDPYYALQSRLLQNSTPDLESGCRIWTGARSGDYGMITHDKKQMNVHRAMWIALHREIPIGHSVKRTCNNTLCIAEAHLVLEARSIRVPPSNPHRTMRVRETLLATIRKERPPLTDDDMQFLADMLVDQSPLSAYEEYVWDPTRPLKP